MFGKLELEQRKTLQRLLVSSGMVEKHSYRKQFLHDAGLQGLIPMLPMEENDAIFAGALVRECERLGKPPSLGEYATVLLAVKLREKLFQRMFKGTGELSAIIAVYVSDHESRYPLPSTSVAVPVSKMGDPDRIQRDEIEQMMWTYEQSTNPLHRRIAQALRELLEDKDELKLQVARRGAP